MIGTEGQFSRHGRVFGPSVLSPIYNSKRRKIGE